MCLSRVVSYELYRFRKLTNYCSLMNFSPDEGYYQGGKFLFEIDVPEAYNMVVSTCRCMYFDF